MIGTSISRYEIREELGQGGMSTVYLGRDSTLGREVAVKILHEHLAKKEENRQRFRREAQAIAALHHPNIVDVYDYSDEADARAYIVMEYIPGQNLREFIDAHGHPPPEVGALIGVEICQALAHAHDHGIIHRDLKPENIMVSADGVVKLMDFGIAHVVGLETMTQTGSLLGSPAHMAPEVIDGQKVDARADVFALGTVLYLMTTGQLPFDGRNAPQVLKRVIDGQYDEPELVEARMCHRIARIICKCLERDPADRYQTIAAVERELLAVVHSMGIEDAAADAAAYLSAPRGYVERLESELVDRLLEHGKRAIDRRDVPEAVAFLNRVLAYEPDHDDVRELLASLNRGRDRRRIAVVAAAVLIAGALGWVVFDQTRPPPVAPLDPATGEAATEGVAAAVADAERTAATARALAVVGQALSAGRAAQPIAAGQRHGFHSAQMATDVVAAIRTRMPVRRVAPRPVVATTIEPVATAPADADAAVVEPKPAEPQTFLRHFVLMPPPATLNIDGRSIDRMAAASGIELERGRHRVRVTSPGCRPYEGYIVVNEATPARHTIALEWRPGEIEVITNRKALVWIGDEVVKRIDGSRGVVRVPFGKAESLQAKKEVRLRVASQDRLDRPEYRTVEVQPGRRTQISFNFEGP